ncbi:MAG: glucuronate isomerase [Verrucomicrobiota bacterium]
MSNYIDENFLLHGSLARRLFHEVADQQPIIDYHNHLSPREIAEDQRWENISEIWLGSDHYKWRLMRANGIPESHITGNANPREKFNAWAATVPAALRNPIHHWTHMELQRYFGIHELLSPATADMIWERTSARLADDDFSTRGILKKFDVRMVGTTDDPADPLDWHESIAASGGDTKVLPTFRPDMALGVDQPGKWNAWLEKLKAASDMAITRFADLLAALKKRHDDFHALGARLSDHGMERMPAGPCDEPTAARIFDHARVGQPATPEEKEKFSFFLMCYFGELDAARGWTKQLHLGVIRNVNSRAAKAHGPDTGFDIISDEPQLRTLLAWFDELAQRQALPKVVLYNLNPRDNYLFACLAQAFQDGTVAGKIQFGSGWWFLDQKFGMEKQFEALSVNGLLSRFIGMLTDSRSFLSFPRHEYFRRILCNVLGTEAERGELPGDFEILAELVRGICFENAKRLVDS